MDVEIDLEFEEEEVHGLEGTFDIVFAASIH